MPIEPNTVVNRRSDVEFNRLGDEALAIDLPANACYSLNLTGMRVWDLLEQPRSAATISADLVREFPVDPAICLREVMDLLNGLQQAGLVTVVDVAGG